jgi:hypothetical protein
MGKPSAPPAPDYAAAATAQGVANQKAGQQTAVLNNPNIISPYGNQTVSYDSAGGIDGTPQPTITQTLTPEAQATLTAQQGTQRRLADLGTQAADTASNVMGTPFNYNGPQIQTSLGQNMPVNYGPAMGQYGTAGSVNADQYGNLKTGADMSGVARMPVNAGMTGQQAIMNRLQPQLAQQSAATAQQLANQGITPGSEAYNNAMREQQQGQNDLLSQAALQGIGLDMSANQQGYGQAMGQAGLYNQAIGQGYGQGMGAQQLANQAIAQNYGQAGTSAGLYNQAAAQQFNQNLGAAQFGNTATQQAYQQQLAQYNQPLNQISALMSGSQIQAPQFQSYSGGGQIGAAPVAQAATNQGNYNTAAYNAQMQALGGLYQGIGSIGGMAAGAAISDVRFKSNIVKVGDHPKGFGIYEYDIFGRRERGVLAQEVEKIIPEAVLEHPDGYKMVNYGAL